VELVDYQCPVCQQAATRYGGVLRAVRERYGRRFDFLRVDFPLDNECNSLRGATTGGLHPAACEAAAAVRLARRQSPRVEEDVVKWLWDHQKQLTPELVFDGVNEQFALNVREHYEELRLDVAREAAEGRAVGVLGTPTFFLNGRRLPLVTPEALETAIAVEIDAADGRGRTL
jgi:hypothetical protein